MYAGQEINHSKFTTEKDYAPLIGAAVAGIIQ